MYRYIVVINETNDGLVDCETKELAIQAIKDLERFDLENGLYEDGYYGIYDSLTDSCERWW